MKILLCLVLFVIIKREESPLTYLIDGISAALFVMVVEKSKSMQSILEKVSFISIMGKYTMSIYLLHNFFYLTLGYWLFSVQGFVVDCAVDCVLVFIECMAVVFLFAIMLQWCLDNFNKIVSNTFEWIASK